ncbi:heterokaryon incompatibility protein-domain-containing protein [Bisporella sp. PMI_857]|nr:heterokaryon incompatibility protein-domain-containing protein [Bisporella sp. PMI_857]
MLSHYTHCRHCTVGGNSAVPLTFLPFLFFLPASTATLAAFENRYEEMDQSLNFEDDVRPEVSSAMDITYEIRDDGSNTEVNEYEYYPLEGENMIRVLILHENKSRLECSIRHIKVSDGGYQALSYEWGSSNTPFRILVRNEKNAVMGFIPLSINLTSALQDLRDSPDVSSKTFWIDQISINQNNVVEKGHQVFLMRKIYRRAARVITYLGPHQSNIEEELRALDLLNRVDHHFRPNYRYFMSSKSIRSYSHDSSPLPVRGLPDLVDRNSAWPLLVRIVYGAWTRRLWMVQENTLCPDTIMLRGHREIDWMTVAAVPILFYTCLIPSVLLEREWTALGISGNPDGVFSRMWLTWRSRWSHVYNNDSGDRLGSLQSNLCFYAALECRDPRDKIYAIMGVSSDVEKMGVVPDYMVTQEDLFLDVSTRIYLSQDLYLLENVSGQIAQPHANLPSWSYTGSAPQGSGVAPHYPHPSTRVELCFEDQNKVMVIRGRVIDKVRFVTNGIDSVIGARDTSAHIQVREQILQAIAAIFNEVQLSSDIPSQLLYALIADPSWSLPGPADASTYLWYLCRNVAIRLAKLTAGHAEHESSFRDMVSQLLPTLHKLLKSSKNIVPEEFWSPLTRNEFRISSAVFRRLTMYDRSISITEDGRFCNVAAQARRGDVIALLAGGRKSYVLRPTGNKYMYVGTAYVHDFANGVAYKEVSPEEVDEEIRLI